MRIATYNVNSVRARMPVILRWLKETKPDVACLQELKAQDADFPEEAFTEAGYGAIWYGQKSWNGVAILARGTKPEETARGLAGATEDVQSRYLEAVVHGLTIGCLYLPNGNPAPGPKFDYKLRWMERLREHATGLIAAGSPAILAGDFNVIPTEQDAYQPERWTEDALFRPETRSAFEKLLAQGWTDAIRHLHPTETIYTYFDYFRNAFARNAGLRIDHFLITPDLLTRLKTGGADLEARGWEKSSDHVPAWIELE